MKKFRTLFYFLLAVYLYLVLFGTRLGYPPLMYFDEVYYVPAAKTIALAQGYPETTHPPLGKLLIAASIRLFGDYPWAWRLPSLAAGGISLVLIYLISVQWSGKRFVGFAAALLFALDGLSLTHARTAIFDAPMLAMMLGSVYALGQYSVTGKWNRTIAFLISGICFGLALATRWVALSFGPMLMLIVLKKIKACEKPGAVLRDSFLYLCFVPLAVYAGIGLAGQLAAGRSLISVLSFNKQMFVQHWNNLHLPHRYASPWWSWPLALRPVWLGFNRHNPALPLDQQTVDGILCLGNPLISWTIPLALGCVLWRFVKTRSGWLGFILAGFFTQWLQWSWIPAGTTYHYFYTAMPFASMAIAETLGEIRKKAFYGTTLAGLYFAAVLALFIYWYPLWTGWPITDAYYRNHLWFPTWK